MMASRGKSKLSAHLLKLAQKQIIGNNLVKAYRGDQAESRPSDPAFTITVALPVLQEAN